MYIIYVNAHKQNARKMSEKEPWRTMDASSLRDYISMQKEEQLLLSTSLQQAAEEQAVCLSLSLLGSLSLSLALSRSLCTIFSDHFFGTHTYKHT